MNKKETLYVLGGFAILIGIVFIAIKKAIVADDENKKLRQNNLKMLVKIAENEKEFNSFVAEQIEETIKFLDNKNIDKSIVEELQNALDLYKLEKAGDALLPIVKILENILSTFCLDNEECKTWLRKNGKKSGFKGWLDFCHIKKIIDDKQYELLDNVRELRNRKTHDLAFNRSTKELEEAITVSVSSINTLLNLAYPQTIEYKTNKIS